MARAELKIGARLNRLETTNAVKPSAREGSPEDLRAQRSPLKYLVQLFLPLWSQLGYSKEKAEELATSQLPLTTEVHNLAIMKLLLISQKNSCISQN
jgi:hypothetical protein